MTEALERITKTRLRHRPRYSAYKDSGVEWLGEIPVHWEVKPVKAALIRNDSGVWGENFDDDGTIVLRSTEQTVDGRWRIREPARRRLSARESAHARLRVGDLLVTKSSGSTNHIGKTSVVNEAIAALNCCYSNFMQRLSVSAQHVPQFFWYFMNCPVAREQLVFLSSTTTGLGNLNGSTLGAIRMPMAPPDEQRAIAAFLDCEATRIDELVERQERLIDLLQEKRTAVITRAVTRGLDPHVPMKDSGVEWLGEIPVHWRMRRLKNWLRINEIVLPDDTDPNYTFDYVDIGAVGTGFLTADLTRISFRSAPSRARRVLRTGDTIVSTVRTYLKAVWSPKEPVENLIALTGFAVLNPTHETASRFVGYLCQSDYFTDLVMSESVGVTYPAISDTKLGALEVCVPPLSEQISIATFLDRETARIDHVITKIRYAIGLLKEFRTALISAAVTGKIDVRASSSETPKG